MKTLFHLLCGLVVLVFASFTTSKPCDYAGSNMGYILTQTKKAISAEDHKMTKFFTYRALNALEKSKPSLAECGCEQGTQLIIEGLDNLKNATKASTLASSRILLNKALTNIEDGTESLEQHDTHNSQFNSDLLTLNTSESIANNKVLKKLNNTELQKKIDQSLKRFKASLNEVVQSVDCEMAYNYAKSVQNLSDKELALPSLSEGKRYYHLKTREIVTQALKDLGDCAKLAQSPKNQPDY